MKTTTKVMKLGGSYAVIIPASFRKHLGLEKGVEIVVEDVNNTIILYPPTYTLNRNDIMTK